MSQNHFDVVIVGAGISGTALFYELAAFSDVSRVALLEKYDSVAGLNLTAGATRRPFIAVTSRPIIRHKKPKRSPRSQRCRSDMP